MQVLRIHIASPSWMPSEYERIQRFYEKYRDPGNSIRDPEKLINSIEDHKSYLITDKLTNELIGVSFCFTNGDGDYTESGGTRIIKNGYGLQRVVSYVKSMHEFIMDPPLYEYYCVIKEKNAESIHNMSCACFQEWQPDQRLLDLRMHYPLEGRHFFVLPRSKLPEVQRRLLALIANPILKHRNGGEPVRIEFDIGIIRNGGLKDIEFDPDDDES